MTTHEHGENPAPGPASRRLVVLYPFGLGHYVDREFLGFAPGYQTFFIVPSPGFPLTAGVPITVIPTKYGLLWPARFGMTAAGTFIPGLTTILRQIRAEIVVTYELHSSLTAIASDLQHSLGFRHVILCYETGSPALSCWGRFPPSRAMANRSAQHADLIVAHTERAKSSILELGISQSRVRRIYPGVYPSQLKTEPAATDAARPRRVGYLGGLRANKGITVLLDAIALYNSSSENVATEFRIAGSGPLVDEVRRLEYRYKNVHLVGWIPEVEKNRFLSELDLLVYPSSETKLAGLLRWEEQTATSALEAMAEGVPVLGSTSGALPEIIADAGGLFRMDSSSDLAAQLELILADRTRLGRLREQARSRAMSTFDIREAGRRFALSLAGTTA